MTNAELRQIISYSKETGKITRFDNGPNEVMIGDYWTLKLPDEKNPIVSNRIAVFFVTGKWPKGNMKRKNNIRTDNRFDNLIFKT